MMNIPDKIRTQITTILAVLLLSFTSNSFSQCVIAGYPFYGNPMDTTTSAFHGIAVGANLVSDCEGSIDSAYAFDGIDDYIELNNNNPIITSSEFSVHIKAKILGSGGGVDGSLPLFSQRDDVTTSGNSIVNMFAQNSSGNIQFNIRGSSSSTGDHLFYPTPTDGDWHCYTGTLGFDDTLRLYLDGVEVAKMKSTQTGDFSSSIDHVEIGRHSYSGVPGKGLFNGNIDEVIIYNCAINPDTVCCNLSPVTSISNPRTNNTINIYPNPSSKIITIENSSSLKIYNMMGKLVFYKKKLNQKENVDISRLPTGIYHVELDYGTQKLIKN